MNAESINEIELLRARRDKLLAIANMEESRGNTMRADLALRTALKIDAKIHSYEEPKP